MPLSLHAPDRAPRPVPPPSPPPGRHLVPPSRRSLLRGGLGLLGGAGAAGALAACGSDPSISDDPDELVMWYWDRSASPALLEQATEQIPGTQKHLRADVIGTSFDTKLRTSLAGRAYIPDITYINSNNALYFPNEDMFWDLRELGVEEVREEYFEWKWDLGITPEGRFCFFPLDIGPTGFYFREDIFAEAGLPSAPAEVSAAIATWEDWIELGRELRDAADAAMVNDAQAIFEGFLNSSPERYFDVDENRLYEQPDSAVRQAWEVTVAAIEAGCSARIPRDRGTDQNAAWASGRTAGNIAAAWWTQVLEESAPDTAGLWRIADQPVRSGNNGGSFAAIPHTCKDPDAALEFIRWVNTPANQAAAYQEVQLFPSAPAAFDEPAMAYAGDFYGDQDPLEFFSTAAETVPSSFISTWETVIGGAFTLEITNVETAGKDPELAWQDAMEQADRRLTKRGVEE